MVERSRKQGRAHHSAIRRHQAPQEIREPAMRTGQFRGFGARYPSFSLPDGLYPNHRISFHQHQKSPLQQNEALRTPRISSQDGRSNATTDSMLLEARGHDRSVPGIFRFRDYLLTCKDHIKLLLAILTDEHPLTPRSQPRLPSRLPRRALGFAERPERTRVSCYAALTSGHACGFH
jgi:hypothetical protein